MVGSAQGADGPLTGPIKLTGDRVTVGVTIDGEGPFDFLIDTGGVASLIQTDLARELNLPTAGTTTFGIGGAPPHY